MTQMATPVEFTAAHFRQVMGQYPTGVVAVTSFAEGQPVGMVIGSFSSLSLEPPLIAFMVANTSSSWPGIRAVGRFCVNILAHDQEELCLMLSRPAVERFDGVDWQNSRKSSPRLAGAVAYVDCVLHDVVDAGDHVIVIGRVIDLDVNRGVPTLLFHQGGYGAFQPLQRATSVPDVGQVFRAVSSARRHMDSLSQGFHSECTALAMVDGDLVLVAAAGLETGSRSISVPVGHRLPYRAPLGTIFAAWGGDGAVEGWIRAVNPRTEADLASCRSVIDRVRHDGYAVAVSDQASVHMEVLRDQFRESRQLTLDVLRADLHGVLSDYNQTLEGAGDLDFQFVSAPVLNRDGKPVLSLSLWGPATPASKAEVDARVVALTTAAAAITAELNDG